MLKTTLVWCAAKFALIEYVKNSDYYNDVMKFNFTGTPDISVYDKVTWDLAPPKEQDQIDGLYKTRFADMHINEIYDALGLPETKTRYSPIESKWAFEYFKKFGTLEYDAKNTVSLEELLARLSIADAWAYVAL